MLKKTCGSSPAISESVGTIQLQREGFFQTLGPPRSPKVSFFLKAKEEECDPSLLCTSHVLPHQSIGWVKL